MVLFVTLLVTKIINQYDFTIVIHMRQATSSLDSG